MAGGCPGLEAAPPPEGACGLHPEIAFVCGHVCQSKVELPVGRAGPVGSCRGLSCSGCLSPRPPGTWPPPQVIGLLDVFTPDETLDDFTDL